MAHNNLEYLDDILELVKLSPDACDALDSYTWDTCDLDLEAQTLTANLQEVGANWADTGDTHSVTIRLDAPAETWRRDLQALERRCGS